MTTAAPATASDDDVAGAPDPRAAREPRRHHRPARSAARFASDPERLLPALVLIGLVVALAVNIGPALLGVRVLAGTDILMSASPWKDGGPVARPHNGNLGDSIDAMLPSYLTLHARLWGGDLPLWNSLPGPGGLLTLGSYPTLTPVSWPWLIFPTSWAAGFVKLLQLLVAFFGMAGWLRQLGQPRLAAGLAGLLYVGSGFLTAWSSWTAQTTVACLAPVLFWSLERLLRLRTVRAALAPPLIVAFLLFGNFPAVAGYLIYAAGAYVLVRLLAGRDWTGWQERLKVLGLAVGGLVLGVAIAAVQVVLLLGKLSETDVNYRAQAFFAQQPFRSLLSLLYPQIMNQAGYPRSNPIEAYAFVGVTAVTLCLVAVLAGRYAAIPRGLLTFFVVGSALAAALIWKQGWWTDWMADLPIFAENNTGRVRGVLDLLLCALAGVGVGVLVRFRELGQARRRVILWGVAAAVAGIAALSAVVLVRYGAKPTTATLITDAVLAVAGAAVVLWCLLAAASRWRTATLGILVVAVTAGSMISMDYFYSLSKRDTFYPQLAVVSALQEESADSRMVALGGFLGSTSSVYGLRSATGHVFYPASWKELLLSLDPESFTGSGTSPTNPVLHLDIGSGSMRSPLLDRMSVSAVYLPAAKPLPGTLTNLNGQPADSNPGGTLSMPVTASGSTVQLVRAPLRGIRVRIAAPASAGGAELTLHAVVTDSTTGATLATGLATRTAFKTGELIDVALPLERLPAGDAPLTLTLSAGSSNPDVDPVIPIAMVRTPTPSIRVIAPAADGVQLTYADAHGSVWSRPTAMSRVRWASTSAVLEDTTQRLATMADPATPQSTVLLSAPGPAAEGRPATVTVTRDDGQTVSAVVRAEGAGYLVLADGIQTAFVATVDGAPAELVDADNAFGAVHVPAGTHVVEFRYAPPGLTSGLLVSALGLLAWVALAVATTVLARRSRRARPSPPEPAEVP